MEKEDLDEELKQAIIKKALGYTQEEVVEEYVNDDSVVTLNKKKVTKKEVAPDLNAIKILMDYFNLNSKDVENMTYEELVNEREKLRNILESMEEIEQ